MPSEAFEQWWTIINTSSALFFCDVQQSIKRGANMAWYSCKAQCLSTLKARLKDPLLNDETAIVLARLIEEIERF